MAGYHEHIKTIKLFDVDDLPIRHPERGICWDVFRFCWSISYSRRFLQFLTPWFALSVSSGSRDFDWYGPVWYGVRLNWSHPKNWNVREGERIFTRSDRSLSFSKFEPQEESCQR